ncbi:MAG: hypothetical protein ACYTFG_00625 [Planctomycetota bacterium]
MGMRRPVLGWVLVIIGVIGVITGIVPFITNGLRITVSENLWNSVDLAAHGVEALGLSVEWGMLSSAMGTYLGYMLLWAGLGWLKAWPSARTVTIAYILCGIAVNFTDMLIFAVHSKHGAMRTQMLVFDSIALAIPVVLAIVLAVGKKNAPGASEPA